MSVKDDSAIKVPIEIKTEDIAEIQDLIQKLSEAEGDISRIKSTGITSGASPQTFGGQARRAGGERVTTEGRGGIFGKQDDDDTLPMSFRDRTGRQAMKRGNRFTDLEKQVQQMEEENMAAMGGMLDQFIGMGTAYLPFVGGTAAVGYGKKYMMNKINQKAQKAQAFHAGGMHGPVPVGKAGIGARAVGMLSKVGAVAGSLGPLGVAVGIVVGGIMASKAFVDWLHGPGGLFDIRYRRQITNEMDPFLERREKQEINIGLRTVRVTSTPAVRGQNQVFSTQEAVKKGIPVYNGEFEAFSKGLYL
tara:strand:- start:4645 stop:5556 length:912 start_codon:yes stop_codon:yes gene_type:complete